MARLGAIFVCPQRGEPMEPLDRAVAVADLGLEGCAHARPDGKRQVLLVSAEHLREVGLDPGTIRENLTIEGADVQTWPVGQRVKIGGTELEVTMVCDPCEKMETIRPGLQAELEGRRGMLARVVAGGELAIGDPVEQLGR